MARPTTSSSSTTSGSSRGRPCPGSAGRLGVYLDSDMTMKTHVTRLVSSIALAFFDRFAASVDRYRAQR